MGRELEYHRMARELPLDNLIDCNNATQIVRPIIVTDELKDGLSRVTAINSGEHNERIYAISWKLERVPTAKSHERP